MKRSTTSAVLALGAILSLTLPAAARAQVRVYSALGAGTWIGAGVRDVTSDDAAKAKLTQPSGAYVESVRDGGPASKAGVQVGDIVVDFDGERVRSAAHFSRVVQESAPDRQVTAVVIRGTSKQTLTMVPQANQAGIIDTQRILADVRTRTRDLPPLNFNADTPRPAIGPTIGVAVTPVTDQLAGYFGVKGGLLVSSVTAGSPAANGGIKAGDVITAVNGQNVTSNADLTRAVRQAATGGTLELAITRERKAMTVKVAIPAAAPLASGRRGLTV